MPNYTPTFNLVKPVGPEQFNVSHANENADKLDAAVMKKDGSNSNLAYLNFTNGSQLIVDTNKNILNMVFPDGTTANIPSEFWFAEGKYTQTIAEGDNMMFAGSQGDHYLLKKAVAAELAANPHLYAGVATKAGAANTWGKVTKIGLVNGINTSAWPFGTRIYFDPVTLGFTPTLPTLPNARIGIGMVVKQGTANGIILVDNYNVGAYTKTELDSLFATKPTNEATATNGQILTANGDGTSTYKNLLMPKNWIINGMFDVWQRGTSQTTAGYGSDDRWANEHSGSTKAQSQQAFVVGQTDVPNNPKYFSRTVVTSVAGINKFVCKIQKIEDVTKLAGKIVTLSFWAKADANKNIAIEFIQDFGTGGSTRVEALGVQKFALTTSWQRFTKTFTFPTIMGKTIGADNNIRLTIWFDAGANFDARTNSLGSQSGTFDIANVSLVEGSVAVECQNQPYADVLRECQRYYERGFVGASGLSVGTTEGYLFVRFKTDKRVLPTISVIAGSSLASCISEIAVAERTPTSFVFERDTNHVRIVTVGATYSANGRLIVFRFDIIQADAEL